MPVPTIVADDYSALAMQPTTRCPATHLGPTRSGASALLDEHQRVYRECWRKGILGQALTRGGKTDAEGQGSPA